MRGSGRRPARRRWPAGRCLRTASRRRASSPARPDPRCRRAGLPGQTWKTLRILVHHHGYRASRSMCHDDKRWPLGLRLRQKQQASKHRSFGRKLNFLDHLSPLIIFGYNGKLNFRSTRCLCSPWITLILSFCKFIIIFHFLARGCALRYITLNQRRQHWEPQLGDWLKVLLRDPCVS